MAAVGLFYVGAVLVLNGLLLLGKIAPREAAPLNLFVGSLQVATPFVLLQRAKSDAAVIAAAPFTCSDSHTCGLAPTGWIAILFGLLTAAFPATKLP